MLAQSTMTQPVVDTRIRPFEAIKAVRRLLDNPDDTSQVFVILRAMRGRSGLKMFRRFQASATGAAIVREHRPLLAVLQDRQALAALPEGSLGQAYLAFMMEQDLSAEGLVAASQTGDEDALSAEAILFRERMRDMHDLTHVLTGYGRDPLGELCLLAFMHAQTGNLGQAMIVLMGMARSISLPYGKLMRRAVSEAWRNGGKARWLPEQDWEAFLKQPLNGLRQSVRIAAPTRYLAASPSAERFLKPA